MMYSQSPVTGRGAGRGGAGRSPRDRGGRGEGIVDGLPRGSPAAGHTSGRCPSKRQAANLRMLQGEGGDGMTGRTCSSATILAAAAIECAALDDHRLTPHSLLRRDRRAAVAWLRAKTVQRLHSTGRYSLTGIGRSLGMHHTSIMDCLRRDLTGGPPKLHRLRLDRVRYVGRPGGAGTSALYP